jgi:hypothetical protein
VMEEINMGFVNSYPTGFDWAWLATDKDGHVAVFTTAGCGPIPVDHLNSSHDTFEFDVEREISRLAERCSAKMLVDLPRPDSFVTLAQRGFFTFDWFDIHRSEQESTKMYEAMAVPAEPILISSLPEKIAVIATQLSFSGTSFIDETSIDVQHFFRCALPSRL